MGLHENANKEISATPHLLVWSLRGGCRESVDGPNRAFCP